MSLEILSWNILSGGFYDYGSLGAIPPRIYGFADVIKELKPDIVSLVDTHRWTEVFTVGEIKQIFEYASAYMVKLEDQRLIVKGHDNGITVLTKNPDAKMSAIWLSTRNAIKTHVAGIDIFSVYFDDVSEDTRIKQTKVLLQLVNPDVPTIITGDLNTFEIQNLNKTVNNLSKLTHRYPEQMKSMEISLNEMKRGKVIQLLNSCRFVDLDKYANPTFPAKLFPLPVEKPIIRLDYAFGNNRVVVEDFRVLTNERFGNLSDHYPIWMRVSTI